MRAHRTIQLIRVLAAAAFLAVMWQMTSAHLEHLGVVPHAHHIPTDLGGNAHKDPLAEHHGIFHHHHLPDLAIVDGEVSEPVRVSFVFMPDARDSVLPEAPVFGIEYPPQIS